MAEIRKGTDSMGEVDVSADKLWGAFSEFADIIRTEVYFCDVGKVQ
jgi:fumarate hydratase class II